MKILAPVLCAVCLNVFPDRCWPQEEGSYRFYPLGLYAVNSTNDFGLVKEAGFSLVAGRAEKPYLDAAKAAGLKVLAAPRTAAGPQFERAAARQAVKAFDRHPALWAWYLVDEPDFNQIEPTEVAQAQRYLKSSGAHKPTVLVLYQGYEALHYANLADITMIDRYPIPWLPLANFGQHVTLARLALGKEKPLIAVIQAFDWSSCPEMLPGEKNLRPPTYEEMRCMTYEALARGATGLFYFAYESGRWNMREHPQTWKALKAVIQEVNARLPLFQAQPQWWPKLHEFGDSQHRFNAALESSITSTLFRVEQGNTRIPPGDYVVAVNNTERDHLYWFTLPPIFEDRRQKTELQSPRSKVGAQKTEATPLALSVLGENRRVPIEKTWVKDEFGAYAVHVYGPLR